MYRETQKRTAFLAALCLFLSAVEYTVPKPLPFLRMGLANVPVLLALDILPAGRVPLLILLKAAGQGIVSGTLFSYVFLFSAAGSFASGFAMLGVHRLLARGRFAAKPAVSRVGISLAGALANSCAQLALARFFLFGAGTRYIAPLLFLSASVTGVSLGLITERFAQTSRWFRSLLRENPLGTQGAKPSKGAPA